ncbi:MAG: glycosylhydrolase-like jelly roll fold domain-containing protein, partial [Planctomycetota bacterium]
NFPKLKTVQELSGPWTVKFDPEWGGPESVVFDKLQDWTERPEEGIKYYSGKATYHKTFDLPDLLRESKRKIHLNLGKLNNIAAVLSTGNNLEIEVVNLWPNRLIGDARLPEAKRLTTTNVKKFKPDSPLLPSGLLGPVALVAEE